jgi:isoleucyl-tRNA synthetase
MAKLMAPFAPFSAEDIWQKLKIDGDTLSVHLAEWPKNEMFDENILNEMLKVREVCTEGNALRKKLNIAVKQPLTSFTIVGDLANDYFEIIKDELNVKQILIGTEFMYDTEITSELKREGNYRELVRALQDLRKETGLTPDDTITLKISTNAQELLASFESDLKKTVQIRDISFVDGENEIIIDGQVYKVSIQK